jgi:hypothetical protein
MAPLFLFLEIEIHTVTAKLNDQSLAQILHWLTQNAVIPDLLNGDI